MNIEKFLSNIFLFSNLDKINLQKIASYSSAIEYGKNKIVFNEGENADHLFIVARGKIKVFKISPKGEELILHIQKQGDLIAEAAIFDIGKFPANALSIDDSLLIKIPAQKFKTHIVENPDFTFKILSAYSQRLRTFTMMIEELTVVDVKGRLANYILRNSKISEQNLVCDIAISKKELAKSLGTIPETLSRTLKFMKGEKIIEENDEGFVVLDKEKLKKLTE